MVDDGASIEAVDELAWLHAYEYAPWGVHVAAEHEEPHAQPSNAVARYGLSGAKAALVNDHIAVVVGGRDFAVAHRTSSSRVDLFDLSTKHWLTTFDVKGELARRVGHSVIALPGRALVFGGEQVVDADGTMPPHSARPHWNDCVAVTFVHNVVRCDTVVTASTEGSATPCGRAWHAAAAVDMPPAPGATAEKQAGDAMLVLGGRDAAGAFLSDVWVLHGSDATAEDPAKWLQLTPTGNSPLPLAYHSAVAVDHGAHVLVLGGRASWRGPMLESVFLLDLAANAWSQVAFPGVKPSVFARCNLTALPVSVPLDESTGQLRQIVVDAKATNEKAEASALAEEGVASPSPSSKDSPSSRTQILLLGGFSEYSLTSEPTRFALLDHAVGSVRHVHAPSLGLRSFMGHASVVSADANSVFFFGGQDAASGQWLDATCAIHWWKPQPCSGVETLDGDAAAQAARSKVYENGDEYTGAMDRLGEIRHGQGKCVFADGGVYDGEWRDDQRCGQGVMLYASGDTYSGQWDADMRHGFGIFEARAPGANSSTEQRAEKRYEGQWKQDRKDGKGVVTYADGSQLDATWDNGQVARMSARLERYDDGNGLCTYTGEVLNGLPHGQGESRHARETYVGQWHLGKRSGTGVATLFDGTTYRGDWKNGKRNGFGECEYALTRDKYDGKWVGGVRCGRGVCKYANGSQYDGEWKDDQCHGFGRFTFADATFYEGNWKDNKFCGDGALVLDQDGENAASTRTPE